MKTLDPVNRGPRRAIFDGFPYVHTRLIHELYHLLLLPAHLPESLLLALARLQAVANTLPTWLVLGTGEWIALDADGDAWPSPGPGPSGHPVFGKLLSATSFLATDKLERRARALATFADSNTPQGYLVANLTKGGRPASPEERTSLMGTQSNGMPKGLKHCGRCGDWRGTCLDTNPRLRDYLVTVSCLCENANRCARCLRPLYERKLNANYFREADHAVVHVAAFCGLDHRCGVDAD